MSKILILPGDGIGKEIVAQAIKVINSLNDNNDMGMSLEDGLIGGAAYDETGSPLPDETIKLAKNCDSILLGAVGGPKWESLERNLRPERGLLGIRSDTNHIDDIEIHKMKKAKLSLKEEIVKGLDIVIVRELTGGVYFGQPRGIEEYEPGKQKAVDTQIYFDYEIDRIARVAFDLARKRNNKVTSMEKANVMETGVLWRQVVKKTHEEFQ